jgi:hypothetical protein
VAKAISSRFDFCDFVFEEKATACRTSVRMLPAAGRSFKVGGSRISEVLIYPIAEYFVTKTNRRRIEIHVLPEAGRFI